MQFVSDHPLDSNRNSIENSKPITELQDIQGKNKMTPLSQLPSATFSTPLQSTGSTPQSLNGTTSTNNVSQAAQAVLHMTTNLVSQASRQVSRGTAKVARTFQQSPAVPLLAKTNAIGNNYSGNNSIAPAAQFLSSSFMIHDAPLPATFQGQSGTVSFSSYYIQFTAEGATPCFNNENALSLLHAPLDQCWRLLFSLIRRVQRAGSIVQLDCHDHQLYTLILLSSDMESQQWTVRLLSILRNPPIYAPETVSLFKVPLLPYGSEHFVLNIRNRWQLPVDQWRITSINSNYQICSAYPSHWLVPIQIEDRVIIDAVSYRFGNRVPVLCFHMNQSFLWRAGPPLVGVQTPRRCLADEQLLFSHLPLCIVDSRTRQAAQQMRMKQGYGNEADLLDASYGSGPFRLLYAQLESVNALQDYYDRFIEGIIVILFFHSEAFRSPHISLHHFWHEVAPFWRQVQALLRPAAYLATLLSRSGQQVLMHGEDGASWTSALVSLTKLLMDPFYRTRKGLRQLIEEDWLSFGVSLGPSPESVVPPGRIVFIAWMHAIMHCQKQLPTAFEFNDVYLCRLLTHICAGHDWLFVHGSCKLRDAHVTLTGDAQILDAESDSCSEPLFIPDRHVLLSQLRTGSRTWSLLDATMYEPWRCIPAEELLECDAAKTIRNCTK